jgi:hypothetical protein
VLGRLFGHLTARSFAAGEGLSTAGGLGASMALADHCAEAVAEQIDLVQQDFAPRHQRASSDPDDAATRAPCEHSGMNPKSITRELSELRVDTKIAGHLARIALVELVRWSVESADIRDRVSPRTRRTLKFGALAVALTSVGVVATRIHWRGHEETPPLQTPPPPVAA